ncbi:Protein of unknown function DUF1468 [Rhabdaerophilaceae bacterium]
MTDRTGSNLPHKLVAGGFVVIGLLALWQSSKIPSVAYATVGPSVFPMMITVFILALGVALALAAFRGGWAHDQDGTITELGSLAYVAGGLILNAALIDVIGFILSSTLMFALVARGFGSLKPFRDAAIGFVLAFIAYVGFDRLLGYKIGSGLIESLF